MYLMKNDIREKKRVPLADLLWAVAVVLLVLWALGFATSYTMGGFIHILLVLAIVTFLVRVIQRRRFAP
jgi:asparagine N-glycosylation enzyme membrane subunit Stt3